MRERATAADQLARILYLLPFVARNQGVTLDELAAALGTTKAEVLRDIQEVTARQYYLKAGAGDDIQIEIEGERISVWTKGDFLRPPRLTQREALALGLGLRTLAAEAEPQRRDRLLALAEELEAALAAPQFDRATAERASSARALASIARVTDDHDSPREEDGRRGALDHEPAAAPFGWSPALGADPDILAVLADALRDRETCVIRYLKPGAPEPEQRRIHPYLLAHAEGRMYILGHDTGRGAMRVFRVDRVLGLEPGGERFQLPEALDSSRYITPGGAFFHAEEDIEVTVRYSPRIARWIAESAEHEPLDDGSVVVRHRVADTRWIVRHVLQHGTEALVLEPASIRALTAEAAARLAG